MVKNNKYNQTITPTDKPPNLGKGCEDCEVWGSLAFKKQSDG